MLALLLILLAFYHIVAGDGRAVIAFLALALIVITIDALFGGDQ